ncbi:MAG: DnaJ domain-containing protein [Tenericutes bacterium]|nr:DnaJ domain-containing protein [Mycoplasmatota bacterium]MDY5993582.1 DnaJ domain-containing protein [Bacilli bacterium]
MSEKERYLYDYAIFQEIDNGLDANKPVDFYALLGISYNSSIPEIEKAFFERIAAYHPDLPANKNARENVKSLNKYIYKCLEKAYIILTNENDRAIYDEEYRRAYLNKDEVKEKEKSSRTHQENKKRQTKQKATSQKHTSEKSYSDVKTRSFAETIRTGWKEVREDEKTEPFKERHKNVSDHIAHSKLAYANPVIFNIGSGVIHVCCETWYQLCKFRYITEDNLPKFIIRNRVTIGSLLLAGTLILVPKHALSPDTTPDQTPAAPGATDTLKPGNDLEDDTIVLNRIHVVESGDTVSEYSRESNSTIKYIAKVNDLEVNYDDSVNIQAGQKIIIPYVVDKEDLSYYTSSKILPDGMSLSTFASTNETDINTLLRLNPEAIEVKTENSNGVTYYVTSDTLTVPNFISKSEYKSLKAQTTEYVKTNGNN